MKFLGPTRHPRLNEALAVVYLFAGLFILLSLVSYHPFDPSWNTATGRAKPGNLTGFVGADISDFLLQTLGLAAYAVPLLILLLGWKWIQSSAIEAPGIKLGGALLFVAASCAAFGLAPDWRPIAAMIPASGLVGGLLGSYLVASLNLTGAILATAATWIVSLYLVSHFEMAHLLDLFRWPMKWISRMHLRFYEWRKERAIQAREKARQRAARRALEKNRDVPAYGTGPEPPSASDPPIVDALRPSSMAAAAGAAQSSTAPWAVSTPAAAPSVDDIPIRTLEPPPSEADADPFRADRRTPHSEPQRPVRTTFKIPPTDLLQEPQGSAAYDSQELKEIAVRIKSKFEEFDVLGSVVQINPGPVVTTFEFKPEAGVKYSRITALSKTCAWACNANRF